jgi:hypothetical protein
MSCDCLQGSSALESANVERIPNRKLAKVAASSDTGRAKYHLTVDEGLRLSAGSAT